MVEAGSLGGLFAMPQEQGAEALSSEGGVDEDGTDPGGVVGWIEDGAEAGGTVVAAEEGSAEAPAAAGDELRRGWLGGDEVGAVGDELGVETEGVAEGTFDLGGGVVIGLEAANGELYELLKGGDVPFRREADCDVSREVRHAAEYTAVGGRATGEGARFSVGA